MKVPGAAAHSRRRPPAAFLVFLAAVLALWLPLLGQAERSVFGLVPVLDEVWYLDRAAAAMREGIEDLFAAR